MKATRTDETPRDDDDDLADAGSDAEENGCFNEEDSSGEGGEEEEEDGDVKRESVAHSFLSRYGWTLLSATSIPAALIFLWFGRTSAAFVLAVLGVVAWFMNFRRQLHERNLEAEAEREDFEDEPENEDEL